MKRNELKSAEYVPPGPIRLTTSAPPPPAPAEPTTGVREVAAPPAPPPAAEPVAAKVEAPKVDAALLVPGLVPPAGWTRPPLPGKDDEEEVDSGRPEHILDDSSPDLSEAESTDFEEVDALADTMRITQENVQGLIVQECRSIEELLLEKNRKYGNSFAQPLQVFARDVSPEAQVRVRIDDKLSRIAHGFGSEVDEDTELDLIGYLILHRVQKRLGM